VDRGTDYNEKKINAIRRRYQRTKHDNNLREARKPVPAGEKEVRSITEEHKDAFMEAILQRYHDV